MNSFRDTLHNGYIKHLQNMKCNHFRSTGSGPVLRDTARLSQRYPPIACYGVFAVSQHDQLGAMPPFLSLLPSESMRSGGAIPPPPPHRRSISAILARYHLKTRQKGCDTPSAILSRKGIARYGGYFALGRQARHT